MKHTAAAFHVVLICCLLYVLSLAFLVVTARCSLGTVLTGMKPEVRCTSVASVVSLFVDVKKKMWPISYFCNWVNWQPTWLLMLLHSTPGRLQNETSHITRGGHTLTTDWIQSLLLRAHSCNKAQVYPWQHRSRFDIVTPIGVYQRIIGQQGSPNLTTGHYALSLEGF